MKHYCVTLALCLMGLLINPTSAVAMHSELSETATENAKPATIKVLLNQNASGILLEVKGSYEVRDPHQQTKLSWGSRGKRYFLYPHEDGIKWGENFPGVYQLQIIPTSDKTTMLVNGIQYRGAIEVYNIDNSLSVVNEVEVESYLKSVLPPMIHRKYPAAVMDSIAIVARTDAYHNAVSNKEAFWHVEAADVGYRGYGLNFNNTSIDRSIDNTRHLIMTYDERPFASTWNKNCAGKTASFQSIFRKNTCTPKGVESHLAAKDRDEHHWSLSIETEKLASVAKTNRVTELDLFVDHHSNKVYAIRVKDGSHSEDIDFITLQKALGEDRLLSNDFTVSLKGNLIIFEGYGEGTGVGVCIYSACQMSERGDLAPKILAEFYPYTHLEKVPSHPEHRPVAQHTAQVFEINEDESGE